MSGSPLVAADVLRTTFGTAAGTVVTVASLVILASSLNVNFLGMPRVAFGLARNRLAPASFQRVGAGGTPGPALVFISVLILGLAVSGAFELLIRFMMTIAITVDLIVLAGIFRLRRTQPDLARPLKVPLYPWLPAVTVLLYAIVLAVIVGTQPVLALGAAAMLGALWVAGLLVVRSSSSDTNATE
jgi:APA family basic amino acid/polyamine antiporter